MSIKTKLFISYSRRDRGRVEKIHDELSSEKHLAIFRDTDDILPTEEWRPRLEKLIRDADIVLFALSPHSVSSDVCNWELELANSLNKRIIPIVIENVDGKVPEIASKLNYIFLTEQDDFARGTTAIKDATAVDIEWIREHTRLGELADRWERSAKIGAQPLRGKELVAAEDWLASHPPDAPLPTPLHRTFVLESRRTQARRQKAVAAGSVIVILVISILSIFAWVQRGAAIEGRQQAELALKSAIEAADDIVLGLARDFESQDVPKPVIGRMLERAEILQDKLRNRYGDDSEIMRSRGTTLTIMATSYLGLGNVEKAQELAEESLKLSERLIQRNEANGRVLYGKSVTLGTLSLIARKRGDTKSADVLLSRDTAIVRDLLTQEPDNLRYTIALATNLNSLATSAYSAGLHDKALSYLADAQIVLRKTEDRAEENPEFASDHAATLVAILRNGSIISKDLGNVDRSRLLATEAVKLATALFDANPNNSLFRESYIASVGNLASFAPANPESVDFAGYLEQLRNLRSELERVAVLQRRFVLANPEDIEARRELLFTTRGLLISIYDRSKEGLQMVVRRNNGTLSEADRSQMLKNSQKAKEIWAALEIVIGPPEALSFDDPNYAFAYARTVSAFAGVLKNNLDYEAAKTKFRSALDYYLLLLESDPENQLWLNSLAATREEFGDLLFDLGEFEKANALFVSNILRFDALLNANPSNRDAYLDLRDAYMQLVKINDAIARPDDALFNLVAALEIMELGSKRVEGFFQGNYFLLGSVTTRLSKRYVSAGLVDKAIAVEEASADLLAELRNVSDGVENETQLREQLGSLRVDAGTKRLQMEDFAGAKEQYENAITALADQFADDPTSQILAGLMVVAQAGLFESYVGLRDVEGMRKTLQSQRAFWAVRSEATNLGIDETNAFRRVLFMSGLVEQNLRNAPDKARPYFLQEIEIGRGLIQQFPEDHRYLQSQLSTFRNLVEVEFSLGLHKAAQENGKELYDLAEIAREKFPGHPDLAELVDTANAYFVEAHGTQAHFALFDRNYAEAEILSRAALAVDPEPMWLYTNLAHALMFQGKVEEAQKTYLGMVGRKDIEGNTWQDFVKKDFDDLRAKGITHPFMQTIEEKISELERD